METHEKKDAVGAAACENGPSEEHCVLFAHFMARGCIQWRCPSHSFPAHVQVVDFPLQRNQIECNITQFSEPKAAGSQYLSAETRRDG